MACGMSGLLSKLSDPAGMRLSIVFRCSEIEFRHVVKAMKSAAHAGQTQDLAGVKYPMTLIIDNDRSLQV